MEQEKAHVVCGVNLANGETWAEDRNLLSWG